MQANSPWWYRMRGLVFGLVYIAGFIGGSAMWSMLGHDYEPAYAWIAQHWGVDPRVILACATLCMVACWALRALGAAYLHADVVWNPNALTNVLIVDGPFAYTRNPLYFGNVCMAFGVGSLAVIPGYAFIVVASVAFALLLATYETTELRRRHGALVDDYVKHVPALLPRLIPARHDARAKVVPSLAQGLRSEIFTGSLSAGMLVLVAAGHRALPVFNALWIAGWIAQQTATWNRVPSAKPPGL